MRELPEATIARLPLYIRALGDLREAGSDSVPSSELARRVGVSDSVLRRDLSYLDHFGTRGVGYPVDEMLQRMTEALGLSEEQRIVIVGVGHIGEALAGYPGFGARGLQVVALLDNDPARIGAKVGDPGRGLLEIRPVSEMAECVAANRANIGVIATPVAAAQQVADDLVAAGVRGILNFAGVRIEVPAEVDVRQVDLAAEMQILAVLAARRGESA